MTTNGNAPDTSVVRAHIQEQLVGREIELELLLAAVAARRHVLLEGPPGTSKTTMLKAITREWGIPLVLVEGNSELSPGEADRAPQPVAGAARRTTAPTTSSGAADHRDDRRRLPVHRGVQSRT